MHSETPAQRSTLLPKAGCLLLFLAALLGLRTGIQYLDANLTLRGQQSQLIRQQDIDPAALFYTQSTLALRAEKTVRGQIAAARQQ
jgi:hypothetical protein